MKNNIKLSRGVIVFLAILILVVSVFIVKGGGDREKKNFKIEEREEGFLGPQTPPPTNLVPDVKIGEVKKVVETTKDLRPAIEMTVDSSFYKIPIQGGETLKEAMDLYESQNSSFTFSGREMPGLGFFVDEINGVKNGGGLFWVYYINDVSATEGVSSFRLSGGEKIRWERRVPGDY